MENSLEDELRHLREKNASLELKLQQIGEEANSKAHEQIVELSRALQKAEMASEAKSDFLANITHEIRTPLNGIIGMLQLVLGEPLEQEKRSMLEVAEASAESLLAIVNEVLDFSKIDADKIQLEHILFEVRPLLEKITNTFSASASQKSIRLTTSFLLPDDGQVVGDPTRIGQVISNLVGNAVKFTQFGSVSVVARLSDVYDVDLSEAVVPRFAFPCNLHISVADTGIGIPPDKHTMIFEAFSQADGSTTRNFGGTGLGLAIVRRLVDLMGGRVRLESEVGQGSVFSFYIPVQFTSAQKSVSPAAITLPNREGLGSHRLLVVDDNLVNQEVTKRHLERLGQEVVMASNGLEALEYFNDGNSAFDLILMDLQMPVMDGFEATRRIRQLESVAHRTPIIALSAHVSNSHRSRVFEAGMDAMLSKPLMARDLFDVLVEFGKKGIPTSSHEPEDFALRVETDDELLRLFAADWKITRSRCEEAFRAENWTLLQNLAHRLKGVLLNLNAEIPFQRAQEFEMLVESRRLIESLDSFNALLPLINEFVSKIGPARD